MMSLAQTFLILAPVLKPMKWLWDQQAHQVVRDSEDQRASKVNQVQRDQMALGVKLVCQDLRVHLDPKDQVVCPFKECPEYQEIKERKEILAFQVHRVSQEALVHQDVMAHQARGAFQERMDPRDLQDHQGQ